MSAAQPVQTTKIGQNKSMHVVFISFVIDFLLVLKVYFNTKVAPVHAYYVLEFLCEKPMSTSSSNTTIGLFPPSSSTGCHEKMQYKSLVLSWNCLSELC